MYRLKNFKIKSKKTMLIIFLLLICFICRFRIIANENVLTIENNNKNFSSAMNENKYTEEIKDTNSASVNVPIENTAANITNQQVCSNKNEPISSLKTPSVLFFKSGFDFSDWNNTCDPILIVINKYNAIPKNYNYDIINYKNKQINKIIKYDLDNMINDAEKDGISLYVSSGYRSIERQTRLFNNQISKCKEQGCKNDSAETMAATVVAKPGTSEHHTGLAIDFNGVKDDFYKTKEYNWLIKNSPNYGFILRYDNSKKHITNVVYEPWHFRYVGKEHAKNITKSGLCLEEYIESIIKK